MILQIPNCKMIHKLTEYIFMLIQKLCLLQKYQISHMQRYSFHLLCLLMLLLFCLVYSSFRSTVTSVIKFLMSASICVWFCMWIHFTDCSWVAVLPALCLFVSCCFYIIFYWHFSQRKTVMKMKVCKIGPLHFPYWYFLVSVFCVFFFFLLKNLLWAA